MKNNEERMKKIRMSDNRERRYARNRREEWLTVEGVLDCPRIWSCQKRTMTLVRGRERNFDNYKMFTSATESLPISCLIDHNLPSMLL